MSSENTISPELQAKIDALTDENLKANILRYLGRPWKRAKSNEQIFDEIVAESEEVMAERAKWRKWSDEEVLAFVEYFKHEMPEDFAEFLRQERENNEIDDEVWWRVGHLADKWIPGLDFHDCTSLLGKVRGYMHAHVIERGGHHE
jgi:hypothetical protein